MISHAIPVISMLFSTIVLSQSQDTKTCGSQSQCLCKYENKEVTVFRCNLTAIPTADILPDYCKVENYKGIDMKSFEKSYNGPDVKALVIDAPEITKMSDDFEVVDPFKYRHLQLMQIKLEGLTKLNRVNSKAIYAKSQQALGLDGRYISGIYIHNSPSVNLGDIQNLIWQNFSTNG